MPAPSPVKLSETEIATALSKLPGWTLAGGKLHREYKFADFIAASFTDRVLASPALAS